MESLCSKISKFIIVDMGYEAYAQDLWKNTNDKEFVEEFQKLSRERIEAKAQVPFGIVEAFEKRNVFARKFLEHCYTVAELAEYSKRVQKYHDKENFVEIYNDAVSRQGQSAFELYKMGFNAESLSTLLECRCSHTDEHRATLGEIASLVERLLEESI